MKKYLLFALPALSFSAVCVDGSLDLNTGYRYDRYVQTSVISGTPGVTTFKGMGSLNTGLDGRMSFNRDFFVRTFGSYGIMLRQPKVKITDSAATNGEKKYVFSVGGAVGWQFDLCNKRIALYPEFGYGYSRLKFDTTRSIAVGAPFAGFGLHWMMANAWSMDIGLEYAFSGSRREIFFRDGDKITQGSFQGPTAKITFAYDITKSWSIGLGYRFTHFFSRESNFVLTAGQVRNFQTKWTSHQAFVNVGYNF